MVDLDSELGNLRDAPRRISRIELKDGKIIVSDELICIHPSDSQYIEKLVHPRDKIAAIHTSFFKQNNERRSHCYYIVNRSKKAPSNQGQRVFKRRDIFLKKAEQEEPTDEVVGEWICELRFEHLISFSRFK